MITKVQIKNYRSIVDATVELSPFTLLIGANGTGKSNFLRLFEDISQDNSLEKHVNHANQEQKIIFENDDGLQSHCINGVVTKTFLPSGQMKIFQLNPNNIGKPEALSPSPCIQEDGTGAVKVLDALKTGDSEDLFELIERDFKRFIPEIEKLLLVPGTNEKQLQVREKYIEHPVPVSTLSKGARLILTILTIIHQENPPKFIGLEKIDRGLHPRLFQQLIERMHYISREQDIQIVATTHNPYLIDQFKDREEAVIIVEKHDGATTFTSLDRRLENLLPDEMPLGALWYSGIVGGVPEQAR